MFSIAKYIKFILPVLLIALILFGYIRIIRFDPGKTDPVAAISPDNILFIETSRFNDLLNDLTTDNEIWNEIMPVPLISDTDSLIRSLESLQAKEEQISLLFSGKVILAVNKEPDGNFSALMIGRQLIRHQGNSLIQALKKMKAVDHITASKFDGINIYEVHLKPDTGIKSFVISFRKGLFILGNSSLRVEKALSSLGSQKKSPPVLKYARIHTTVADNLTANIFFNFSSLDEFFSSFTLKPFANSKRFAASGGFDLELQKNSLSANGFITVNDSLKEGIGIISGQNPELMKLTEFIPASACLFLLANFNTPSVFFTNQPDYELWKPNREKLEEINSRYSIDLLSYFSNNITGEFGMASLFEGNKQSQFFIAEVNSGSNTEGQMQTWTRQWAKINGQNHSNLQYYKKIDNQSGINVYRLPLGGIPSMIFGQIFKDIKADYYTVYQNCLIFGNSAEETANYTYQLMLGRNITETEKYKNLQDNLLSRTNFFIYLEPFRAAGFLTGEMKPDLLKFYHDNAETLKKFNAFTFQTNSSDDLFYTRMFILFTKDVNEHVNMVWQSKLDTIITLKPAIVTNHTNAGKEIMVQDAKNQLYLISNAGRILWKIPLDGNILGDIYQIDYYNNRRLQYLFNTRNKIYLIDRNGNFVEKYPLPLRSPASNGLALLTMTATAISGYVSPVKTNISICMIKMGE
mgnify:CR=1 FL=1